MNRRTTLRRGLSIGAALTLGGLSRTASAQSAGQLRIVNGFAAGGSVDLLARLVGEQLSAALGRTAIVENRTGAAGRLAVEAVKAAAPDGDTLLLVPQGPMTLFTHVFRSLKFDPNRDFAPVMRLCTADVAITTGPLTGARDLGSLVNWLRTAGPKATYGSPGAGTILHFAGVSFARAIGVPMTHVPYRGSALSITDLAGGAIATVVSPVTEAMETHAAGRVRIVATASAQRTPFVQGVPTLKESGIDVDVPLWFGLYAPAGTPAATLERLRGAIAAGLATPTSKERLDRLGLIAAPTTSAELLALQTQESQMWGPIVRASGFSPED
jgi:tripartite-type tricarboxylate transporter receptor subunit TctC